MEVSAVTSLCLENLATVLIFAVTSLTLVYLTRWHRRSRELPPGPLALPVIGNLHNISSNDFVDSLNDLRRKHGDIYRIYLGSQLAIVLNGYDAIQEALIKKGVLFGMRSISQSSRILNLKNSLVLVNGPVWKQHRSFSQRALQEVGLTSTGVSIEDRINQQVDKLVDVVKKVEGPLDIGIPVSASIYNIVIGMVVGQTFKHGDSKLNQILDSMHTSAMLFSSLRFLLDAFPILRFLKYLPWDVLKIKKLRRRRDAAANVYGEMVDKSFESFRPETIDTFAHLLIKKTKDQGINRQHDKTINYDTFKTLCREIAGAGTETTASTICWLILYLLKHPDVQKKLHQDIDEILGREERPALGDRAHLPYVEATIMETMRIAAVLPLPPHSVPHDVRFRGHLIPENTSVIMNLNSVLKDPNVWSDPGEFRPGRFLTADGEVHTPKEFIPFSLGRRSCLGESLARMELFLFTTRLLQKFEFRVPDGDPVPDSEGILGISYSPKPFSVCVHNR